MYRRSANGQLVEAMIRRVQSEQHKQGQNYRDMLGWLKVDMEGAARERRHIAPPCRPRQGHASNADWTNASRYWGASLSVSTLLNIQYFRTHKQSHSFT